MEEVEESERALEAIINELSNLSEKLKELSEGVSQIVETLKREHTSLKPH